MVIPPEILANAKGLAIITQIKAGFLFSGRAGSGVIIARLPDGSWSAPSAIVTAGAGVGGQIGAEITDFVFILNTRKAVETFSHAGSITLGGNVSVAVGPLGRNAEMAGSASLGSVAAIFSYSKTKGLFAGVSLEGSMLVERREANRKFYGTNCTAKTILSGRVEPPPECDILFRVLDSRAFNGGRGSRGRYGEDDDDYYDDIPDDFSDNSSFRHEDSPEAYEDYNTAGSRHSSSNRRRGDSDATGARRGGASSWEDDFYDEQPSRVPRRGTTGSFNSRSRYDDDDDDDRYRQSNFRRTYSDHPTGNGHGGAPRRPTAAKPDFDGSRSRSNSGTNNSPLRRAATGSDAPARYDRERQAEKAREHERAREANAQGEKAVALFSFETQQAGDLGFRKGDIITVVKRSESRDDWWTGSKGGVQGIFPANYVELV